MESETLENYAHEPRDGGIGGVKTSIHDHWGYEMGVKGGGIIFRYFRFLMGFDDF